MKRILRSKLSKIIAVFLAIQLIVTPILENKLFALTGGPSQPEVQSFCPINNNDMVDLFTGDFKYNIPLLDIEGFPINIFYDANITMDQEASWVGLGWNINPGVINRSIRGLPDDFKGEVIRKDMNIRANKNYKFMPGIGIEIFGAEDDIIGGSLNFALGVNYNNYTGIELLQSMNLGISVGESGKGALNAGIGLNSSSTSTMTVSPNVSFSYSVTESDPDHNSSAGFKSNIGVSTSFNSRSGLQELRINASLSYETKSKKVEGSETTKGSSSSSMNRGSHISFGTSTYTPQMGMPFKNTAITFSGKLGGDVFGIDGDVEFVGGYSEQTLDTKTDQSPAYGYLYLQNGQSLDKVLLDFNREKDGAYSKRATPNLPIPNLTYDIFSVMGHTSAGTYRAYRSDVGTVFDSKVTNTNDSYSLGLEFAFGNLWHGGADINYTDVFTRTGKWSSNYSVSNRLKFHNSTAGKKFEPAYFKQVGDFASDPEPGFFTSLGGNNPIAIKLNPAMFNHSTQTQFYNRFLSNTFPIPAECKRSDNSRVKRNSVFSYLTFQEAEKFCTDPNMESVYSQMISSGTAKNHHIAEITILNRDGSRSVYGLPLYNTLQEEVSFNSYGLQTTNNYVHYNPADGDNTSANDNERDEFFQKVSTPPFAHSYELTSILTPDYMDVTGDGFSEDDLGNYTIFKYSPSVSYKWRVPYQENTASYNEGLKSDGIADERGSYIYGTKELRYLNEIETKHYVAKFYRGSRDDGFGVLGENGGRDISQKTDRLEKIEIYAKTCDGNLSAYPVKAVHFEYTYELCPETENNKYSGQGAPPETTGKLTLKKIYFTYGKSNKAAFSPYEFDYSSVNPPYNIVNYDRWGNYSAQQPGNPPLWEYPYVDQQNADNFTQAWKLKNVTLPSGAEITMEYESDDYAYVQDKQAMKMYKLYGFHNQAGVLPTIRDVLYLGSVSNNYVYFEIDHTSSAQEIFSGMSTIYFKCLVHLKTSLSPNTKEYVSGYAEIDPGDIGVVVNGGHRYAYVKLEDVSINDNGSNTTSPISKATWQFGKIHAPVVVYNQPNNLSQSGIEQTIMTIAGFVANIFDVVGTFSSPYTIFHQNQYGSQVDLSCCWVRANCPEGYKKGGGHRVRSIVINDKWAAGNETATEYKTSYKYDKTVNGKLISSGVAAYEPMIGNEENPFRQPITYDIKNALIPDERFYMETPMGETFFPAPTVGYNKVTVFNDVPANSTSGTGYVVNEFFTYADYPIFTSYTEMDVVDDVTDAFEALLSGSYLEHVAVSQGYIIELNDMHGKQKAQWVYAEGSPVPISGIEYKYYDDSHGRLVNSVKVIESNGIINPSKELGIDVDVVVDTRENKSNVDDNGISGNLAAFLVGVFPAFVGMIFPNCSHEETIFRSVVVSKVVRHYGIIESVTAHDLGSVVETKNLAFDSETGEVLLTQTVNEFNDPIYNFGYPSHWAFDEMGSAYKNIGFSESVTLSAGGIINISNPETRFVKGDEVCLQGTGGTYYNERLWITNIVTGANGSVKLLLRDGSVPTATGTYTLKILRSGRRNLLNTSVGSLTALSNPLDHFQNNIINDVVSAKAVEYSEPWKIDCYCLPLHNNGYTNGLNGNWRLLKEYSYLDNRQQTNISGNSNIRKDGCYNSYSPFWKLVSGKWQKFDNDWTWVNEVSIFNQHGQVLETKDALNRFSAVVFGFGNSLVKAVASNSKYNEVGYDGCEDYCLEDCVNGHFSFAEAPGVDVVNTVSHTGKKSIRLAAQQSIEITKILSPCTNE